MNKYDTAPTRHYVVHQNVSPNDCASDAWLERKSLQEPVWWAQSLGMVIALGFSVGVFAVVGWLLGLVRF